MSYFHSARKHKTVNMILEILIFFLSTLIAYYLYSYKKVHYDLESKGLKFLPGVPLFGNTFNSTMQKRHIFEDVDAVYKAFPNERYVAYIENTKVIILIRDPEIIKLTTVKDFDHFVDHRQFFDPELDPLFGGSLFAMKGEKWRDMRSTLSPAFTGSKMRHIIQFIHEISHNFVEHLKDHLSEDIDVDDLMRRFTNDVIASASFGLKVNSLKDKNNEFFEIGQKVLNFDLRQMFMAFLSDQFPSLTRKLGVKLYPQKMYDFFEGIVSNTINHRKSANIHQQDMLQLLIETPKEWTLDELTSQVFLFFSAGFETTASVLVMCIHELALNPDIQERLYQEMKALKERDGQLNNDNMPELKYLDCVINETLRRWSPSIALDRSCGITYELPPPRDGGKPFVLKPGDMIYNSSNSLHLDPQYHPDPLTFNPDRFSDESKSKMKPFTFSPFGSGPRNCIGIRFAIMEIKVLLYHVLLSYKILKCSKTTDPIELVNYGFNIRAKSGTWVQFVDRV